MEVLTTHILHAELWDKINELAMKSKKISAAVGYVSTGANKLLPLRKNDSLVVDMSLDCVKNGQTNPFEIGKYIKKGVNVYTVTNLHAKVYVFDGECIVCSANVSINSSNNLLEAGLLSDEKETVTQAQNFIKSLSIEPVTPEYLALCKKNYRPRKYAHTSHSDNNLWILGTVSTDYEGKEAILNEKEEAIAEEKIKDSKRFSASPLKWTWDCKFLREVSVGDLVLQVKDDKVVPPSRVIHSKRYKSFDDKKSPRIFVYLEEPDEAFLAPMSLSKFQKKVSNLGLRKVGSNPCRRASKQEKQGILKMWHSPL